MFEDWVSAIGLKNISRGGDGRTRFFPLFLRFSFPVLCNSSRSWQRPHVTCTVMVAHRVKGEEPVSMIRRRLLLLLFWLCFYYLIFISFLLHSCLSFSFLYSAYNNNSNNKHLKFTAREHFYRSHNFFPFRERKSTANSALALRRFIRSPCCDTPTVGDMIKWQTQ